jgi:hypothetical protein
VSYSFEYQLLSISEIINSVVFLKFSEIPEFIPLSWEFINGNKAKSISAKSELFGAWSSLKPTSKVVAVV